MAAVPNVRRIKIGNIAGTPANGGASIRNYDVGNGRFAPGRSDIQLLGDRAEELVEVLPDEVAIGRRR